jgi:hypothetical protein
MFSAPRIAEIMLHGLCWPQRHEEEYSGYECADFHFTLAFPRYTWTIILPLGFRPTKL